MLILDQCILLMNVKLRRTNGGTVISYRKNSTIYKRCEWLFRSCLFNKQCSLKKQSSLKNLCNWKVVNSLELARYDLLKAYFHSQLLLLLNHVVIVVNLSQSHVMINVIKYSNNSLNKPVWYSFHNERWIQVKKSDLLTFTCTSIS